MTLSAEQSKVVNATGGVTLCLAVPGSGKTLVLTERVIALLRSGCRLDKILCLTFTRAAALEMAERVARSVSTNRKVLLSRICTYHALGRRMLLEEKWLPWWGGEMVGERKKQGLIESCCRPGTVYADLKQEIELGKRAFQSPQKRLLEANSDRETALSLGYSTYQGCLEQKGLLDFDDLIYRASEMLIERRDVRERQTSRVEHLMVDEFQDTSVAQQCMAELLSDRALSSLFVGDPNQAIYGFAGADRSVIDSFGRRYPGHGVAFLAMNYRSTKSIVKLAQELAPRCEGNTAKLVRMMTTPNPPGEEPRFLLSRDAAEEGERIAAEIKKLVDSRAASWKDFALLFRTNSLVRACEEAFVSRMIPYVTAGCSFYSRAEVKLAVGCLRLGISNSPFQPPEFLKSLVPARRLYSVLASWTRVFPGMSARDALDRVYLDLKLVERFSGRDGKPAGDVERAENLVELLRSASRFKDVPSFLSLVDKMLLFEKMAESQKDAVTLSTIHKSKGREWKNVYVCGANEGVLPHRSGNPDEESRLLYVGITRAMKTFTASAHGEPSPLLAGKFERLTS